MSTNWLDEREDRLWRTWLRVNAELALAVQRQLVQDGLSTADFEVLVHLSEDPDGQLHIGDLADRLHWERSRLSHQLTRMAGRDLLRKRECPQDRRGAHIVLTPAGRAAIERVAPGHVRTVRSLVFDVLDERDQHALLEILDRLDPTAELTAGRPS